MKISSGKNQYLHLSNLLGHGNEDQRSETRLYCLGPRYAVQLVPPLKLMFIKINKIIYSYHYYHCCCVNKLIGLGSCLGNSLKSAYLGVPSTCICPAHSLGCFTDVSDYFLLVVVFFVFADMLGLRYCDRDSIDFFSSMACLKASDFILTVTFLSLSYLALTSARAAIFLLVYSTSSFFLCSISCSMISFFIFTFSVLSFSFSLLRVCKSTCCLSISYLEIFLA